MEMSVRTIHVTPTGLDAFRWGTTIPVPMTVFAPLTKTVLQVSATFNWWIVMTTTPALQTPVYRTQAAVIF